MAVKTVSLNVHGHRVDLAAYGEKFIADNDYLAFGTSEDVTMRWDGSNLLIAPLTDSTGAITIGDGTTNMDVIIYGDGSGTKFHFDESADTLYLTALTMLGYGSQFQFTPGDTGSGTGISFYNTNQYIRCLVSSVLELSASSYVHVASRLVMGDKLNLQVSAVAATTTGEIYLDSADARLTYSASGSTEYKVAMYHPTGGSLTLPTGIGLIITDGKLRLGVTAAAATTKGEVYYDSADNQITYYTGSVEKKCVVLDDAGKITLPEQTTTATDRGQLYLDSDNRLTYGIGSSVEYKVAMFQDTSGGNIVTPSNIGIEMGTEGYLRLYRGTVNPTAQGQMYFRTLDKKIVIHDGSTLKVVSFD